MNRDALSTVLVVDDVAENIDVLAGILRDQYRVLFATNGADALALARSERPGLILLDVVMPGMDGYEVCRCLKADLRTRDIPVIFVSAMTDERDELTGLEIGAVDYLPKPCKPPIVRQRVRIHLELHDQNLAMESKVRERTQVLEDTRVEIIRRLGRAAEYRDNETGMHVLRMSHSAHLLALAAGIPAAQADILLHAAPMHDVGKIGIPDRILLKPGKLDAQEWAIMQSHAVVGAEIIGEHDSELLKMARSVALTHHEKWDGSGYPYGLAGEAIPIEGRIAAIADVYDALTSVRPYKRAWSQAEAADYLGCQAGIGFDPQLTRRFLAILPEVEAICRRYADVPHPTAPAAL
ncbi:MAG: response regulator [Rhodocyclales bacterium]|nr:response regulator [Rhodocyclales bacterium]